MSPLAPPPGRRRQTLGIRPVTLLAAFAVSLMGLLAGISPSQAVIALPSAPRVSLAANQPTTPATAVLIHAQPQPEDSAFAGSVLYDVWLSINADGSGAWKQCPAIETGDCYVDMAATLNGSIPATTKVFAQAAIIVSSMSYTTELSAPPVQVYGPGITPQPVPDPTPPPPPPPPAPTPDPLTIKSAAITASPDDPMLKRQFKVETVGSVDLSRYEFGWADTATAKEIGTLYRCPTGRSSCWLFYGPADPGSTWNLMVRAVSRTGKVGPWLIQAVKVPPTPIEVDGGDSVQSGHNRVSEGAPTVCQDENYAMGKTVWQQMQASLPAKWREPHGYINVAVSGFGTSQMLNGGKDACGVMHESEMNVAIRSLKAHAGSWNVVIWDGGINNTNWTGVLTDVIGASSVGQLKTAKQCQAIVDKWDFRPGTGVIENVQHDADEIAGLLTAADSMSKRRWISYYGVENTGTGLARVPSVCRGPMHQALSRMRTAMVSTLADQFLWVDIGGALGGKDELLQELYPSDLIGKNSGWPHPNRKGALIAGRTITRTL